MKPSPSSQKHRASVTLISEMEGLHTSAYAPPLDTQSGRDYACNADLHYKAGTPPWGLESVPPSISASPPSSTSRNRERSRVAPAIVLVVRANAVRLQLHALARAPLTLPLQRPILRHLRQPQPFLCHPSTIASTMSDARQVNGSSRQILALRLAGGALRCRSGLPRSASFWLVIGWPARHPSDPEVWFRGGWCRRDHRSGSCGRLASGGDL
jgi:hypothetical protein